MWNRIQAGCKTYARAKVSLATPGAGGAGGVGHLDALHHRNADMETKATEIRKQAA